MSELRFPLYIPEGRNVVFCLILNIISKVRALIPKQKASEKQIVSWHDVRTFFKWWFYTLEELEFNNQWETQIKLNYKRKIIQEENHEYNSLREILNLSSNVLNNWEFLEDKDLIIMTQVELKT